MIKNPTRVGIPTANKRPKKVTKLEMKSTILNNPKFSKMIDIAVFAEFIYDYPVTVITIIALWFRVFIKFYMQDKQQATRHKQIVAIMFP